MPDGGGLGGDHYRARADKCIYLADLINDDEAAAALRNLAMTYRIKARRVDEADSRREAEQATAASRQPDSRSIVVPQMDENHPDHPARQDECAQRLMAYAAKLRAEARESDAPDAPQSGDEDEPGQAAS